MIAQSVGSGGINNVNDVVVIQCALNAVRLRNGQAPLAVDGLVGPKTTSAIIDFQRQQGLTIDGRIDVEGRTLPRLTSVIGGPEGVFGPAIAQIIPLVEALGGIARTAPPRVRAPLTKISSGYDELNRFRDLTKGLGDGTGGRGGFVQAGFVGGGPRVFGFTGIDDAAAAATLAAMGLILAVFLVLLTQNPAFRREVQVRAKELDRIMKNLQINANTGLKDAVDLIVAVANDTIEEQNRCKQSPTFTPSPQCAQAFTEFNASVARLRSQVAKLLQLVLRLTTQRRPGDNLQGTRIQFNALLAAAQQEAVNLQLALANMREVCKCPDV